MDYAQFMVKLLHYRLESELVQAFDEAYQYYYYYYYFRDYLLKIELVLHPTVVLDQGVGDIRPTRSCAVMRHLTISPPICLVGSRVV